MSEVLSVEFLIADRGEKIPGKCHHCQAENLWKINVDKDRPAIVCSWCDVDWDHRWSGHKDLDFI